MADLAQKRKIHATVIMNIITAYMLLLSIKLDNEWVNGGSKSPITAT